MKKFSSIWLFVAVLVIPISAVAIVNWYSKNKYSLPVLGPKGHTVGNFNLLNQDSLPVSSSVWQNKIVIVNFFFTHCPTICPKMTINMKSVQQEFKDYNNLCLISFTVDPVNDTPVELSSFIGRYNLETTNWQFVTGNKTDIYLAARNQFMLVATDGDGGPSDFIHSEKLVLLDRGKRIRGYYDGTSSEETKQLIKDIKKLQNEN